MYLIKQKEEEGQKVEELQEEPKDLSQICSRIHLKRMETRLENLQMQEFSILENLGTRIKVRRRIQSHFYSLRGSQTFLSKNLLKILSSQHQIAILHLFILPPFFPSLGSYFIIPLRTHFFFFFAIILLYFLFL